MLDRQVHRPSRIRRFAGKALGTAGLVAGAACALAWLRPVTSTTVVTPPIVVTVPAPTVPPPHIVVELPAPPASPLPPPSAPPVPAPPPIVPHCPDRVATLGVPFEPGTSFAQRGALIGATTATDGCTIAAWTDRELVISWDGGQHFAHLAITGTIDAVAATIDRVAVIRDHRQLGVVRAGANQIAWRTLGALAPEPAGSAQLALTAAGAWLAVMRDDSHLIGATDDDGDTWRFTTAPAYGEVRITAAGRLWLTTAEIEEMEEQRGEPAHRFTTDLTSARWLADAAAPVDTDAPAWTYVIKRDRFWGCGGSEKIVALHRGVPRDTVVGDLRPDIATLALATGATATYAVYRDELHRLRGARSISLGPIPEMMPSDALVGVDRAGTAVFAIAGRLVRWSDAGGWRVLWPAADAT